LNLLFWQCWGLLLLFFSLFYIQICKNFQASNLNNTSEVQVTATWTGTWLWDSSLHLYLFSFHSYLGNNHTNLGNCSKKYIFFIILDENSFLQSPNLTSLTLFLRITSFFLHRITLDTHLWNPPSL
jgi:hypothetical protein